MTRILRIATLACLLSSADVKAVCEPTLKPITSAAAMDAGSNSGSELRALVVDPQAGREVGKDTVLAIDLEYRIADFARGQFRLVPLIKTGLYGSTGFEHDGKRSDVLLESAEGRVRLCIPLAGFYKEDAVAVFWPLELQITILEAREGGGSQSIASTKPIKLNTMDIPAVALARQAKAPPPEYEDALMYVFDHFQRQAALYKVCRKQFPPRQPNFTAAYRAWESRHKADIDFVSLLIFEALREQYKGRTDFAMNVIDRMAWGHEQRFDGWSNVQMQGACEEILEMETPQLDVTPVMVDSHLAVLRKWHQKK